jgi:Tfp pilus assembly protein PilO
MANYSKKDIAFVVFRNILFISVILAAYHYGFKKMESELKDRTALKNKYQAIYNDLENFAKINENMYEVKLKIEDVIANISAEYVPNQALIASFEDRISSTANEYSITFDTKTVNRTEGSDAITLSLGFNAEYETVYKFLFAIEMFSRISSLSIDEKSNVSLECAPVLYRPEVDSFFSGRTEKMDDVRASGYFKEIFKKSEEAVNSLEHIPSWRDIEPAPSNPFYKYIPPKVVKVFKEKPKRKPPEIIISGIIYDDFNPIVVIDGKLYRQGDYYKIVKIVVIKERTITVELDGQKYIIKFSKEE